MVGVATASDSGYNVNVREEILHLGTDIVLCQITGMHRSSIGEVHIALRHLDCKHKRTIWSAESTNWGAMFGDAKLNFRLRSLNIDG